MFYFWIKTKRRLRKARPKVAPADLHRARLLILTRVEFFNNVLNLKIGRISIRQQRTRWGSCSSKGNLNFNGHLINLPLELVDYVIVHELCHLKQLNHSPAFWALVEDILPNFRHLRRQLKAHHLQ